MTVQKSASSVTVYIITLQLMLSPNNLPFQSTELAIGEDVALIIKLACLLAQIWESLCS